MKFTPGFQPGKEKNLDCIAQRGYEDISTPLRELLS